MPVLSIILCSRRTARSTETTDFLMFFLLLYACRPNRVRVETEDMLIITEITGLCTLLAEQRRFPRKSVKNSENSSPYFKQANNKPGLNVLFEEISAEMVR